MQSCKLYTSNPVFLIGLCETDLEGRGMYKGYLSLSWAADLSTTELYTNYTKLALILSAFPFQKENNKHSEVQKELVYCFSDSSTNKFKLNKRHNL